MKFEPIALSIQEQIARHEYKPGQRLPSIRRICEVHRCNKATVIRAYQELEAKHLIYAVPKSGYYVIETNPAAQNEDSAAGDVTAAVDFTSASPGSDALPYLDFQHCLDQAIALYRENLFTYMDPRGLPALRETLAGQLRDYQIFAKPETIHITSGSQQALEILTKLPFPNGKTNILLEQPTYFGMVQAARLNGLTLLGIQRTAAGLDFAELERTFRNGNIKFFYTIPRFHNPLGVSFQTEDKKKLLKLAAKYDVYIVEDDYLADLETDPRNDPLFALDGTERVLYIRSYSKTLMPGLRLGVAVLPQKLCHPFIEYKRWADLSTAILSQGALEIYLRSGMYLSHLRRIKLLYQERMACLQECCQALLPDAVPAFVPETGFFASITLPFHLRTIEEAVCRQNVRIRDLQFTGLPGYQRDNLLRLSICKTNPEQIRGGMAVIAAEIQKALEGKGYFKHQEYPAEFL